MKTIGQFIRDSLTLSENDFIQAMKLDDSNSRDEEIFERMEILPISRKEIEAYERS